MLKNKNLPLFFSHLRTENCLFNKVSKHKTKYKMSIYYLISEILKIQH
jgi:hypothetical protein